MTEHEQVGTVEILRLRVYPLDPETRSDPLSTSVVVEPGTYPLYRAGGARYWVMTGRRNGRHMRIGDGAWVIGGPDEGVGPELTFPSPMFGPDEWTELLAEPTFTEGHVEQRCRVVVAGGAQ